MKTTNDIYQMITDKMISEVENGMIPWQKPWQNATNAGCISHTTGKPYSMINQMLLGDRAGEWLTYKQVVNEGGKVRKGEKASFVVFWQMVEKVVKSEQVEEVSDEDSREWCIALYAYYREKTKQHRMVGGACWNQCIPYEGIEHLAGTTLQC